MQVLVNSDRNINGSESLAGNVESIARGALEHFADRITRIEVHLSDVNADKAGARDKRCVMEARLAGLAPIAVSDEASDLIEAVDGAAKKLHRALESALGRIEARTARGMRDRGIAPTAQSEDVGPDIETSAKPQ